MNKKIITICSSASFYKEVVEISYQLKKLGFRVKIPGVANIMKKTGNYKVEDYKHWLKDKNLYHLKKKLMKVHFKKIMDAHAILVVNLEKNGIKGYIGGNGLLEMFLAYQNKKPIFVWEETDKKSILIEEILSLDPIFINHDLAKIKFPIHY